MSKKQGRIGKYQYIYKITKTNKKKLTKKKKTNKKKKKFAKKETLGPKKNISLETAGNKVPANNKYNTKNMALQSQAGACHEMAPPARAANVFT